MLYNTIFDSQSGRNLGRTDMFWLCDMVLDILAVT